MNGVTPADTRLYAIGDIHGCSDLLRQLLGAIAEHDADRSAVATRQLIFLGDYVDRGPDSKGVIDVLLDGLPAGFEPVFLKGNHEEMMLNSLDDSDHTYHWFINGGRMTLESYGIRCRTVDGVYDYPLLTHRLREKVEGGPHEAFLRRLRVSHRAGGYYFVHAGVHPELPLDQQREEHQLWIRDRFLNAVEDFGAVVVHGHTPTYEAEFEHNRIGIDTGAVYGGALTAVCLEDDRCELISVPSEPLSGRVDW
jgi:serine/threonine protein phosphatase 1